MSDLNQDINSHKQIQHPPAVSESNSLGAHPREQNLMRDPDLSDSHRIRMPDTTRALSKVIRG